MGQENLGSYVETVAVRIGLGKNAKLIGTGVLYTVQEKKRAVVITAGHVLYENANVGEVREARLAIKTVGSIQNIPIELIDDSAENRDKIANVHYCPEFEFKDGKYIWDVAFIEIPWENWMEEIPEIYLEETLIGQGMTSIGFPISADNEATEKDWTAGRCRLESQIQTSPNQYEDKAFKFSYHVETVYPITRTEYLEGYSGSGMFLEDSKPLRLLGLVSQSYGDDTSGNQAWATSSFAVKKLLKEHDLLLKDAEYNLTPDAITEGYPEREKIFMEEALEKLNLSKYNWQKTHQEERLPQQFRCENGRRCDDYWKGRSKAAVYIWVIKGDSDCTWEDVQVEIQTESGEMIPVNLEFLCTEGKEGIADIVRTLIMQGGFSSEKFSNQTIFLWNSNTPGRGVRCIPKSHCLNIIGSIVSQNYKREKERENMFHVTKGDPDEMQMAIISLDEFQSILENVAYEHYDDYIKTDDVKAAFIKKLEEIWK